MGIDFSFENMETRSFGKLFLKLANNVVVRLTIRNEAQGQNHNFLIF